MESFINSCSPEGNGLFLSARGVSTTSLSAKQLFKKTWGDWSILLENSEYTMPKADLGWWRKHRAGNFCQEKRLIIVKNQSNDVVIIGLRSERNWRRIDFSNASGSESDTYNYKGLAGFRFTSNVFTTRTRLSILPKDATRRDANCHQTRCVALRCQDAII
jgi:hypothetical protein